MPWDDVNNVNRTDVMNPGQKSVKSFDLMRHYRKGAKFRKMYDTIMNMLKSSLIDFDKHDYDSIQVNYNEAMAEHTDDINKGHSLCFAVGNYEGGELCINTGENVRCFDINGKILKYNGRVPHSVSDILNSGGEKRERYSFVIYKRVKSRVTHPASQLWLHTSVIQPGKGGIVVEKEQLLDLRKIPQEQRADMLDAIWKEIKGLVDLGTFSLEPLPAGQRALDSRIVLKVKYRADGSFDKNKARLVARGFLARMGTDFFSTFSPMASLTAVRAMCSLAVSLGLPIKHSDIPQAFIQSDLDSKQSYMDLPKGISLRDTDGKLHTTVKLKRALYGLKQSPQLWSKALNKFFIQECGFTRAKSETCLYYKHQDGKFIILLCEVDDLVYTGDPTLVAQLEQKLIAKWNVSQSEDLKSFLGINIHYDRTRGVMHFDVAEKIKKIFDERPWLKDIGWSDTPMETNQNKTKNKRLKKAYHAELIAKLTKPEHYASVVGAAIFISTACRPDITQTIGRVSRAMHNPTVDDANNVITLLKYLNTTKNYKLTFRRENQPIVSRLESYALKDRDISELTDKWTTSETVGQQLYGLSDADYANKLELNLKSTSGFCYFYRHNLISWKSKLQPILATSTHEAELIALNLAAYEGIWLRNILCEFRAAITGEDVEKLYDQHDDEGYHSTILTPTKIMGDNMGAVHTAGNPVSSKRSKHVDVRYLKIREYIEAQRLQVKHVEGTANVADLFTKPLPRDKHASFVEALGITTEKKDEFR